MFNINAQGRASSFSRILMFRIIKYYLGTGESEMFLLLCKDLEPWIDENTSTLKKHKTKIVAGSIQRSKLDKIIEWDIVHKYEIVFNFVLRCLDFSKCVIKQSSFYNHNTLYKMTLTHLKSNNAWWRVIAWFYK